MVLFSGTSGLQSIESSLVQLLLGVPSAQVISECVPNLLQANLKPSSCGFLSEMKKISLATETADHMELFPPCVLQGYPIGTEPSVVPLTVGGLLHGPSVTTLSVLISILWKQQGKQLICRVLLCQSKTHSRASLTIESSLDG